MNETIAMARTSSPTGVRLTTSNPAADAAASIADVQLNDLLTHRDPRGALTELFRDEWPGLVAPVQWNYAVSEPNVLRGVHVHHTHWDYLILLAGKALIGLSDLRAHSPTFGRSGLLELDGNRLQALVIPPGVAHGFYFPVRSAHVYAVSHVWDKGDELGCRWDEPGLKMSWPTISPELSERDRTSGTLAELRQVLARTTKR